MVCLYVCMYMCTQGRYIIFIVYANKDTTYTHNVPAPPPVVFLLEVQYSILKSLISTCVLSYVGSREDWLLDRICESKKDCWDSIRRTSYPYQ